MDTKQKHPKRPRDINQRAASTVAIATGQVTEEASEVQQIPEPTPEERHTAAVMLGRKGGQTRAKRLTPEQKQQIAQKAARTRWGKEA
jgi:hypothetical protein